MCYEQVYWYKYRNYLKLWYLKHVTALNHVHFLHINLQQHCCISEQISCFKHYCSKNIFICIQYIKQWRVYIICILRDCQIITVPIFLPTVVKIICFNWATQWHSWLRHSTTIQKVTGSIPDFIEIFHGHNFLVHTVAMGSTQPLTEMSTRNIFWGVNEATM